MLVGRGARAGRGMPRGWTALCLLSLLREYRPRARAGGEGPRSPAAERAEPGGAEGRDPGPHPRPTPTAARGSGRTRAL